MNKRKNMMFDPMKIFSPGVLRTNLLLSSLYLTAFEILKIAIIEGLKDYFIVQNEITPEQEQRMLETLQKELVERSKETYLHDVAAYESAVGIKLDERDKIGLIPSCKWLEKEGVLSKEEVRDIKAIRDQRNEIAHELPFLLTGHGIEFKLEHFNKMRSLLHKVDVFWARNNMLVNPDTFEEVDVSEISDEELISMRFALLNVITDTVVDYLNELAAGKPNGQANENE